jgi:hypothetical protein
MAILKGMEIKLLPGKNTFQFRLSFFGRHRPVEFLTSTDGVMMVMQQLRQLQAQHKFPMPRAARPSGKSKLRLVPDDK